MGLQIFRIPCVTAHVFLVLALLGFPLAAWTQNLETVLTRDNRLYRGFVSETADGITVRWGKGDIALANTDIASRSPIEDPNVVFEGRLAETMKREPLAEDLVALADEARDALAFVACVKILRQAIAIDLNHAEARERLGFEKFSGRWLPRREARYQALIEYEKAQETKGLADFRGRWVEPDERERLARGEVRHEGRWMALAERDALLARQGVLSFFWPWRSCRYRGAAGREPVAG